MNRKLFLLLCMTPIMAIAQNLTLEQCQDLAHDNYPAIKQYGLIEQTRDFTVSNASKGWLPQVSISGGAYAFTDIISSDNAMASNFDLKNYMANASITVNQSIYDGGKISANKRVAKAEAEVQSRQLDVTLYEVNERVEQLFFGILMIDEQIEQNKLLQEDLKISYKSVNDMISGGIANESDLDAVKVEQLKAEQQLVAYRSSHKAYMKMLGTFIGQELDNNAILIRPEMASLSGNENLRPELEYYSAQNRLLNEQKKQLDTRLLPTLSFFGTGMIHSKVSPLMNNGLLIGGISLSWNIGALYTRKNDLNKIELNRSNIETQRATFLFNNRLQNESSNGSIDCLQQQIAHDDAIVKLRESIRQKSEKKVQLGTESVNELLRNVNAVSQARQQKAIHEIQLLKEIYNRKHINNN